MEIREIQSLWLDGEYPYPPFFHGATEVNWTTAISETQNAMDSSPFSEILNDPGYPGTSAGQQSSLTSSLQATGSISAVANSSTGSAALPYGFETEREVHTLSSNFEPTFLLLRPSYLQLDARVTAEVTGSLTRPTLEARVRLANGDGQEFAHVVVYCDYDFGCRNYKWTEIYQSYSEVPPGQDLNAESEVTKLILLPAGLYTLSAYASGTVQSVCSWVGGPTGYYTCETIGGDASFEVTLADGAVPIPLLPEFCFSTLSALLLVAAACRLRGYNAQPPVASE